MAKMKEPGSNMWLLGQLEKMANWPVVMVDGGGLMGRGEEGTIGKMMDLDFRFCN